MEIKIEINCNTISELHSHLTELCSQINRSAKKQRLNPKIDEFVPEDADSLCDDNCCGTREVKVITHGK